jgi:hypothetical protein
MNPLLTHFRRDASRARTAVSWIAVSAVLFGVWLAPVCASICANMASEARGTVPDHCQGEAGMSHKAPAKSDDCQTRLCERLQAAVQTNVQSGSAAPSSAVFHVPASADQVFPQVTSMHRPWLSAMALGPPVPPPLFTVLRA